MKFDVTEQRPVEHRTRETVARLLLERGPLSATDLVRILGLSATAIRRHLDGLLGDGMIEAKEQRVVQRRGRGRPARVFALTGVGREAFPHRYDDLAAAALRYLAHTHGEAAVQEFATTQIASFEERHGAAVAKAGSPQRRIWALAEALSQEGYAASAHAVGAGGQLCQHHCPVAHVATEFPQLCEAETRGFERMLGTHVQRLATIARGDEVCTTYVPAGPLKKAAQVITKPRSGRKSV